MEHFYTYGPQAAESLCGARTSSGMVHVDAIVEEVDAQGRGLPDHASAVVDSPLEAPDTKRTDLSRVLDGQDANPAPANADPGIGYIYEHSMGHKCLVFSNSREDCEAVTTTLRSYCEANGEPDRFLIHHGNLSSSFRETAEDLMRDDELALTTCTTATLELDRRCRNAPSICATFGCQPQRGEPR